jgi:hypothetical protein
MTQGSGAPDRKSNEHPGGLTFEAARAQKVQPKRTASSSRTISPDEVSEWFGKLRQSLNNAQYDALASRLTGWRWPSDSVAQKEGRTNVDGQAPDRQQYWDVKGASKAAQLLLDSVPAMLAFWRRPRPVPIISEGYEATKALRRALLVAKPFIEWPLGKPERRTGRKRPKNWHVPAVLVASYVIEAIVDAGSESPGITRNSVVVRVVRRALRRMGYPQIEHGALGAHLARWDKKYGLTPNRISKLWEEFIAVHGYEAARQLGYRRKRDL